MKLVLAAVVLLLSAVLALQWSDWPPRRAPAPETGNRTPAAPASLPVAESPLDLLAPPEEKEEYAVVIERPLFLPDRRPPSDEPQELEPEPSGEADAALDRFDLSAVMIIPDKSVAWVRDPANKDLRDLELGDELDGWTVKEILADRLVLERQGETDTLTLRDYQNSPPPAAPARPRPAARTPPPPRAARQAPPPRPGVVPGGQGQRPAVRRPNAPPPRGARNPRTRSNAQLSQ